MGLNSNVENALGLMAVKMDAMVLSFVMEQFNIFFNGIDTLLMSFNLY
jgi:hypothetical protein